MQPGYFSNTTSSWNAHASSAGRNPHGAQPQHAQYDQLQHSLHNMNHGQQPPPPSGAPYPPAELMNCQHGDPNWDRQQQHRLYYAEQRRQEQQRQEQRQQEQRQQEQRQQEQRRQEQRRQEQRRPRQSEWDQQEQQQRMQFEHDRHMQQQPQLQYQLGPQHLPVPHQALRYTDLPLQQQNGMGLPHTAPQPQYNLPRATHQPINQSNHYNQSIYHNHPQPHPHPHPQPQPHPQPRSSHYQQQHHQQQHLQHLQHMQQEDADEEEEDEDEEEEDDEDEDVNDAPLEEIYTHIPAAAATPFIPPTPAQIAGNGAWPVTSASSYFDFSQPHTPAIREAHALDVAVAAAVHPHANGLACAPGIVQGGAAAEPAPQQKHPSISYFMDQGKRVQIHANAKQASYVRDKRAREEPGTPQQALNSGGVRGVTAKKQPSASAGAAGRNGASTCTRERIPNFPERDDFSCQVYVGGIDLNCPNTWNMLHTHFGGCGEILDIDVNSSNRYAHITFGEAGSVQRAVDLPRANTASAKGEFIVRKRFF